MYFTSKIFNGLKMFCAVSGMMVSGTLIIYGAVESGAMIFLIGGVFFFCSSLFHCFDSSKVVMDIKKEISKMNKEVNNFRNENHSLNKNLKHLEQIKDEYFDKIESFNEMIIENKETIEELETIKIQYEDEHIILAENVKKFIKENKQLQKLIVKANNKMLDLEEMNEKYKTECEKFKEENEQLSNTVSKLTSLYNTTKELMIQLANFGDDCNDFAKNINTSIIKLDSKIDDIDILQSQMKTLLTDLSSKQFYDFDKNEDGVVTQSEFEAGVLNMKK